MRRQRATSINWKLPRRFWFYAAAVFVYGIVETFNGNWARLDLIASVAYRPGSSFAMEALWRW